MKIPYLTRFSDASESARLRPRNDESARTETPRRQEFRHIWVCFRSPATLGRNTPGCVYRVYQGLTLDVIARVAFAYETSVQGDPNNEMLRYCSGIFRRPPSFLFLAACEWAFVFLKPHSDESAHILTLQASSRPYGDIFTNSSAFEPSSRRMILSPSENVLEGSSN